jgi:hypothetical protein
MARKVFIKIILFSISCKRWSVSPSKFTRCKSFLSLVLMISNSHFPPWILMSRCHCVGFKIKYNCVRQLMKGGEWKMCDTNSIHTGIVWACIVVETEKCPSHFSFIYIYIYIYIKTKMSIYIKLIN